MGLCLTKTVLDFTLQFNVNRVAHPQIGGETRLSRVTKRPKGGVFSSDRCGRERDSIRYRRWLGV